jgi:hypothetical protein
MDLRYTSEYAEKFSRKLSNAISNNDLLETLRWLVGDQKARNDLSPIQIEACRILIAYFTEQKGDLQGALKMYRSLIDDLRPNSAYQDRVERALNRILQKAKQN